MPVKDGDNVKVEYEGTLDDGTVFDSSEKHGPLEFEIGAEQVIKGFEEAVKGMEKGQEKQISLKSAEAYGDNNPQLIQRIPRDKLPQDQEPKTGMALLINLPNGSQVQAKITEVTKEEIVIDLNHPLAGKDLSFKIKVVEIS